MFNISLIFIDFPSDAISGIGPKRNRLFSDVIHFRGDVPVGHVDADLGSYVSFLYRCRLKLNINGYFFG